MITKNVKKITALLISFLLLTGLSSFAQQGRPGQPKKFKQSPQKGTQQGMSQDVPYSDEEVRKFADVIKDLKSLRRKNRKQMQKKVKESDLSTRKYSKMRAKKKKNKGSLPDSTAKKDRIAFNKLDKEIQKVRKNYKEKMDSTLKANDMSRQKFQEMARSMKTNKAMQKKVRSMM